jgi:hypothetical protein
VADKTKPDRADVCIIGAGASGALAAKVLAVAALAGGGAAGVSAIAIDEHPAKRPAPAAAAAKVGSTPETALTTSSIS